MAPISEVEQLFTTAAVDALRQRERTQMHRLHALEKRLAAIEIRLMHLEAIEIQKEDIHIRKVLGRTTITKKSAPRL